VDMDHEVDLDHDADLDHDLDHEVDYDLAADHDADADADHGADHEVHASSNGTHHGADHGEGIFKALLSLLGVGKVPITVLVQSFMIAWAIIGWNANIWLAKAMRVPEVYILPSMAVSFFGALAVTRLMATCLHKLMPSSETYARSPLELLSASGTALFRIDGSGGYADVYDEQGTLHRVRCRSRYGEVPKGAKVTLVDYHGDGLYEVAAPTHNGSNGNGEAKTGPEPRTRSVEVQAETRN